MLVEYSVAKLHSYSSIIYKGRNTFNNKINILPVFKNFDTLKFK